MSDPSNGPGAEATWVDVFPWLGSARADASIPSEAWRHRPISEASNEERASLIEVCVQLILQRFEQWSLGELFPAMPDAKITSLDMPVRAENVFARLNIRSTVGLADLTVDEILGIRNMGVGTLEAVLASLAQVSLVPQSGQKLLSEESAGLSDVEHREPAEPEVPAWQSALTEDLQKLAHWYTTVGLASMPLLGDVPYGAPESIRTARASLSTITARDVLPDTDTHPSVADHLEAALYGMHERAHAILRSRLFAESPRTLDALGQELGVTRERIRQLESRARAELTAWMTSDTTLGEIAEAARREVWMLRPLAGLLASLPALADEVHSIRQPAWRVLDRLDDAYEIEDGWCATPTVAAAKAETASILEDLADDFGVVRLSDFSIPVPEGEPEPGWTASWLEHCGYAIVGEHLLTRTGSLNDVAAALLSIEGGPMTVTQIHERLLEPRSIRSLGNAIASDDRLSRVDADRWALAVWELQEYTSIREEIRKALEERGGVVLLNDLVEEIAGRFNVAATSVIAYASAHPYRVRDGVVMMANQATAGSKPPEKSKGYFRRDGAWIYRSTVTKDHLRGSGFVGHSALASIIGLRPSEKVELESRLGVQRFSWNGLQPQVGTIRRFLLESDASQGDEFYLIYGDDGTFDVEMAPPIPQDQIQQALRLAGCSPELSGSAALDALGASISVGVRKIGALERAFRTRGDVDIADLLAAAAGTPAE